MTSNKYSNGFLEWVEQHFVGCPKLNGARSQRLWRWETTEFYDGRYLGAVGNAYVVAKYLTSTKIANVPETGNRQSPITYHHVNDASRILGLLGGTNGDPGDVEPDDWWR